MKNQQLLKAIILLLVGVFMLYWAQSHSPNAGMGKIISNELSGSYTMDAGWYYISMLLGSIVTVIGALRLYKAVK